MAPRSTKPSAFRPSPLLVPRLHSVQSASCSCHAEPAARFRLESLRDPHRRRASLINCPSDLRHWRPRLIVATFFGVARDGQRCRPRPDSSTEHPYGLPSALRTWRAAVQLRHRRAARHLSSSTINAPNQPAAPAFVLAACRGCTGYSSIAVRSAPTTSYQIGAFTRDVQRRQPVVDIEPHALHAEIGDPAGRSARRFAEPGLPVAETIAGRGNRPNAARAGRRCRAGWPPRFRRQVESKSGQLGLSPAVTSGQHQVRGVGGSRESG